jgi:hypothetical protein
MYLRDFVRFLYSVIRIKHLSNFFQFFVIIFAHIQGHAYSILCPLPWVINIITVCRESNTSGSYSYAHTVSYCHNPTNNPKQLQTIFVGVVLVSVRKTTPHQTTPHHHHTTAPGMITILAVLGNLGS